MSTNSTWNSPDGKINKTIIINGVSGAKPTENCECIIYISKLNVNYIDVEKYNNSPVVIGDIDTAFGRLLDKCLQTMHSGETAKVKFNMKDSICFTLELKSFTSKGLIYEWDTKQKFNFAMYHKARGVDLFNKNCTDASHHFGKALKLLASIPIDVLEPPLELDGVPIKDIENLKVILFNNLSSCYLRAKEFDNVIYLCDKVLKHDEGNEKALYKIGVAYSEVHEYDKAFNCLKKLMEIDPDNKPALDKLKIVKIKLHEENEKVKEMARKMFAQ